MMENVHPDESGKHALERLVEREAWIAYGWRNQINRDARWTGENKHSQVAPHDDSLRGVPHYHSAGDAVANCLGLHGRVKIMPAHRLAEVKPAR